MTTDESVNDEADFEELHRLYNFADDDSRQFTRWQMQVALNHGRRLRARTASSTREGL